MIKLFTPLEIKPTLTIKNRMVMPPMCMYSAKEFTGQVNDTHLIHYGARALGQIGLIIVEATGVSENGKITDNCLGLYDDNQIEGFSHLVKTCQSYGAKMAVQLIHSGRKSTTKHTTHYGASEIEFNNQPLDYVSMTKQQIKETVQDFKNAAIRADKAGFDAIELHGAHGYLIHQFLSPLSNQRTDEYGQDRHLFLKEIIREIKSVWPKEKGFWIRLSGTDWHEDGLNVNDIIRLVNEIKNDIDLVHVSSGGLINVPIDLYPGYQIPLAREIKKATGLPVFGVGLLTEADHIISLVQEDIVDGVAIGRELLRNPNFGLEIARKVQKHHPEAQIIPNLYERSFK